MRDRDKRDSELANERERALTIERETRERS